MEAHLPKLVIKKTKFQTEEQNKSIRIPKTYITRSGPLFLYREDASARLANQNLNNSITTKLNYKSLQTTRWLRNSIISLSSIDVDENCINLSSQNQNIVLSHEQEKTLQELASFNDKNQNKKKTINANFEKLRPGHTAKRYLSNWTNHWTPEMITDLSKDGALVDNNFNEQSLIHPKDKHRINYDISQLPAPYRIKQNWLSNTNFLRNFEQILASINSKLKLMLK